MGNKTEGGDGRQLAKMRMEYELVRSNTIFKPRRKKKKTWLHGTAIMGKQRSKQIFNIPKTQKLGKEYQKITNLLTQDKTCNAR